MDRPISPQTLRLYAITPDGAALEPNMRKRVREWLEASGGQRTFLQGLIQVAVAFYHLRRENIIGASRLLTAGMEKLSAFAPERDAVDVAALLATLEPLREALAAGTIRADCTAPRIMIKIQPVPSSE